MKRIGLWKLFLLSKPADNPKPSVYDKQLLSWIESFWKYFANFIPFDEFIEVDRVGKFILIAISLLDDKQRETFNQNLWTLQFINCQTLSSTLTELRSHKSPSSKLSIKL